MKMSTVKIHVSGAEWPMACLRPTWLIAASLSLPLTADDYGRLTSLRVRFKELAQVWTIAHSLLLDHISRTTKFCTYVILNSWSSAGGWSRTCFTAGPHL